MSLEKHEGMNPLPKEGVRERYGLVGVFTSNEIDVKNGLVDIFLKVCDPEMPSVEKWMCVIVPCEMLGDLAAQLLKLKGSYENIKPSSPT